MIEKANLDLIKLISPIFALCTLIFCGSSIAANDRAELQLHNDHIVLEASTDGVLSISTTGTKISQTFIPQFTVMTFNGDPKYRLAKEPTTGGRIPEWKSANSSATRTFDFFETGNATVVRANRARLNGGKLRWIFPENSRFAIDAEVELPDSHEPRVTFRFTPRQNGWYSVGYTGAPTANPVELDSIWQPNVWQERRFPAKSFLSIEGMCSLPAVFQELKGVTVGVAADPAEIPYRLPMHFNSRFGVLLRNQSGLSQPMLFAPVPGQDVSKMVAGQSFTFSMRLIVNAGSSGEAFRKVARGLYGFHDYRHNVACNLNQTLENMIDFAMNDTLSGWLADLKGADYTTDVPGTVKNVSALHPLSIALITDNKDVYQRRALPMTEYLLSREKYLFATREDIKGQSASYLMKGPSAEVSELVSLYQMLGGHNYILRHYAVELFDKPRALNLNMVSKGESWQNCLALYKLTGQERYLQQAVAGANDYISSRMDVPQKDFSDVHVETGGQFWTDFAPKWVDLFELYEVTKEQRFLDAAAKGARIYSEYTWMCPVVPLEEITVNKGGIIGPYYRTRMSDPQPMRVPEQRVPAWQVSQIGLIPEAFTTWNSNPAVFLAHHAAYMLRLGYLTHDSFLTDVARSAIVGRYANFPGYDINYEFTNVYARPDYPLRPWRELTYNNIYYNHVWPHIALLMDYLISDAYVKSNGQINFPSRYAQGYAYLFCKVYGDRAGSFYSDTNVRLWMPRQVISSDNIEINTVTARGPNSFYVALLNQSAKPQKVSVQLNPDVVPFSVETSYPVRTWVDNKSLADGVIKGGSLQVTVPANSLAAFAIDGLKVPASFQDEVSSGSAISEGTNFAFRESAAGTMTCMLLSAGEKLSDAYVWLQATPHEISQAILTLKTDDKVTTEADTTYPYEFSVPLSSEQRKVEISVDVLTTSSDTIHYDPAILRR